MCVLCLLQFAGEAVVKGGRSVFGGRQGQYELQEGAVTPGSLSPEAPASPVHPRGLAVVPKRWDWRSYLCCELHGTLVSTHHGTLVCTHHGTLLCSHHGTLVCTHHGTLVSTHHGTLVCTHHGTIVCTHHRTLVCTIMHGYQPRCWVIS